MLINCLNWTDMYAIILNGQNMSKARLEEEGTVCTSMP